MHVYASGLQENFEKYLEATQEAGRLEAGIEAMARASYKVFLTSGLLKCLADA